ncbi:T9SS type A sorting domain-containing protein [Flavivirga jejuensis]|uniref:T9SS type A sorting domain-containing protein n=1 Tax=Flavivirga jejuensis TaxID=870487 RepID=A0ABT8WLI7_9FLAO|nr:T9SS type A sorting domain-containing protein [Flavivirga jejuensis]MDO5973812.1 T9SS type A sorting domain-containing protein [Flavivirga jejuensis]
MLKLKIAFLFLPLFFFVNKIQAQYLWYETGTENILFTGESSGSLNKNKVNPDINGVNTNIKSSKFVRNASISKGFTYFKLYQPIETATTYTVSLKGYIDVTTSNLPSSPKRLRVYLKNTITGDLKYKQINFTKGQEWEDFSFVFNPSDFTSSGLGSGGYNQMYIGYGNGISSNSKTSYYIDQIYGTTKQTPINAIAESLQGSWGGRLYVRGGEDLDDYVDNKGYDYVAGAQEIVSNYPTMGHVITNATNNANAQLWTLRTNPNVDAVMGAANSIIDEEFVPSLANEQIIIDVITEFKNANKKVILYLNGQSPGNRATAAGAVAWNNYVDTYFSGDGHAAWMDLCEGYIKRFKELGVDGYWLDSFGTYNVNKSLGANDVPSTDAEKNEFVQMIRNVDPSIAITTNFEKDFFEDGNGNRIEVDTDGVEDNDESDYRIIKMTATDPWSDFTAGHITPLAQGAPPNSWAYEEFTVTDIEASPIASYDDTKQTVKHLFLPIRERWSSEKTDLMFDGEQAYRFAKRITDAGGSVTFSNTTDDGTITPDEIAVLNYVDQQFAANAAATPYVRPLGAFLVGEAQTYPWYENEDETITDYIAVESSSDGTTTEDFSNPFKTGINTSDTVTKFVRDGGTTARIYFDLPNPITDLSSLKISLDAFINHGNPTAKDFKIRVFLLNTTLNTRIYKQISLSAAKTWENLEFDFSAHGTYPDGYDQMAIGFANGDASGTTKIYYVDNVKGSINQFLIATTAKKESIKSTNLISIGESQIEQNDSPLKIYPNPVTNSFEMSKEFKSVSIYTITGKKILEFSGDQSSFDVSNLSAGFYVLKANDSKGNPHILKFIKK